MTSTSYPLKGASAQPSSGSNQLGRVIGSCMIGNALEWYDFALYGYFAIIIGELFFPSASTFASLMATFGVFAAGFIMRPLGGVIFGHIGDKIGRKDALMWSIYLMAVPTTLIGLLPTYEQAGVLAPILLTVIRLAQGLSMGGEFTGSMIFVVENSPSDRRGLMGSWVVFSLLIGILVGSAVATLTCYSLSDADIQSWGWRVPFILSCLGGLVGAYMRKAVKEPEEFKKAKEANKDHATPLKALFTDYWRTIIYVIGLELTLSIGFYLIVTFISNYLTAVHGFDKTTALMMNTMAMVAMGMAIPFAGLLSDLWGRKCVLIMGSLAFVMFAYPLYNMLEWPGFAAPFMAQVLLSLMMGFFFAPFPATLVEIFPARIRFSGLSIAHSLSMAIFGGTAPLVATFLIDATGQNAAPALYLSLASFVSLLCLLRLKDRFREPLL